MLGMFMEVGSVLLIFQRVKDISAMKARYDNTMIACPIITAHGIDW
jgi:hypothetical protein